MRKIVVEFIVPADAEEAYADVCAELVIEDFLGRPLRIVADTGGPVPVPAMVGKMNWSVDIDWPNETGYYWFYGWCFRERHYPARIHFVEVRHGADKRPIYITGGHFLYKAEGAEGLWQPVAMPELPGYFAQNPEAQ